MKIEVKEPPRRFVVGFGERIELEDCGSVLLEPNEQVTFVTSDGAEYDVTRKDWGFYATPSLNSRLAGFGLRGVLVKNRQGRFFVLLVEEGRDAEFWRYMQVEELVVVSWLHNDESLRRLERGAVDASGTAGPACMCGAPVLRTRFEYDKPPPGENPFDLPAGTAYRRTINECLTCGHFLAESDLDVSHVYEGAYVDTAYGPGGLKAAFDRIMDLPRERSDNAARADRVEGFAAGFLADGSRDLLDVGSGLGVFPFAMQRKGWNAVALDPDARAAEHLSSLGLPVQRGDFFALEAASLGEYDVVTFNKVLEHVVEPVAMLAKGAALLRPGGFVYVEVPDGEAAAREGAAREEFFIEHLHVFSAVSLGLLARNAGFSVIEVERLQEPSTKFTLRAFLGVV